MAKVLLVGNGAREHAIGEALCTNPQTELFVYGTTVNPGLKKIAKAYQTGSLEDFAAIAEFAQDQQPDFAFIGPDNPIGAGLADYLLHNNNLKSVAPNKANAQLESSKGFTRELMKKHQIAGLPKFRVFTKADQDQIESYLTNELKGEYVVKYDGLLGGKGVKVAGDHLRSIAEGVAYAQECLQDSIQVVIEEKFVGQEFSLIALSDGENLYHFPVVQDHKRAYDGDQGPNTGGMGTYSDNNGNLPFLADEDLAAAMAINKQIIAAVKAETGTPYLGVLYGGFIATATGVGVIEYNARFGDPEAMNLLNVLQADFTELCQATLEGRLDQIPPQFAEQATVCLYAVPKGYPDNPLKGATVKLFKKDCSAKIYFASVDLVSETDEYYELIMSGSRAIAFVGVGETIELAREQALSGFTLLEGPVEHRSDIGSASVLQAKMAQMQNLRA